MGIAKDRSRDHFLRVAQAFLSLAVIAPVTAVSAFPLRTGVAQVGIPAYPVE